MLLRRTCCLPLLDGAPSPLYDTQRRSPFPATCLRGFAAWPLLPLTGTRSAADQLPPLAGIEEDGCRVGSSASPVSTVVVALSSPSY